jgi:hypothetical protein
MADEIIAALVEHIERCNTSRQGAQRQTRFDSVIAKLLSEKVLSI